MEQAMIDKLIKAGGNRWQKGNYDRIYFNAKALGLKLTYYNTGNISSAKWAHDPALDVSNSQARRYMAAKTYVDVKTGEIVSEYEILRELVAAIMEA